MADEKWPAFVCIGCSDDSLDYKDLHDATDVDIDERLRALTVSVLRSGKPVDLCRTCAAKVLHAALEKLEGDA